MTTLPARLTLACGTAVEGVIVNFGSHGACFRAPDGFPTVHDLAVVRIGFLGHNRMAHVMWQQEVEDGAESLRVLGLDFIPESRSAELDRAWLDAPRPG